jgi:DNA-binding transcriptional regulator GbsR (MarR family)
MQPNTQIVVDEFVEKMGLITQADGLPRIAGRVLAVLLIHDEPFSFSQLSEKLSVSRGSISTNTRLLVNLGVIERTTKRGERQDYFKLKEKPYVSLIQGVQARLANASEVLARTQSQLPDELSGAKKRLHDMQDFYRDFAKAIESLV